MGDKTVKIVKLSELIGRSTPRTGAFSLFSSPSSPLSRPTRNSGAGGEPDKGSHPDAAIPNQKVLKSLSAPALLTGTLTLPANNDDPASNCVCFQFSDGSATVCCDILSFDLKVIGKKIKILAWNFIPCGSNSGFLEIIRWDFLESSSFSDTFSLFSASITNSAGSDKARHFITGMVEAVSPVSAVSCAGSSTGESSGLKSLCGFLAGMMICECKLCRLTYSTIRLRNSNEHSSGHCFNKAIVVYFCGPASVWHPVMSRLVGRFVSLSGFKKKMVSIGKEICQLMYVTVEKSLMHISNLPDQFIRVQKSTIRGNGECGSYNGIVTAIYMQGMIVELDQQAMLLLTDRDIILPHSLRVGAVVSLKNVHFVNPRFSWSRFLILGSCSKTSVCVKSFSLLETGYYTKPQHQSLLRKFIDSLTFIARLWVLLVIASFRRKFNGILSSKEILGSKNKKGLAQLYATSHLPKSVFLSLHGPFWEFCKHDRCACGSEVNCCQSSLVVPFSNLINYCESIWIKELLDSERVDIMGLKNQHKSITCGSRDHAQLIWRVVHSEEIDIALVGHLKISSSSGRLQIVDATGSIDVAPDFSLNWNFESIYEVKRFTLSMQGLPKKTDHFNLLRTDPFACRSIFESGPPMRKINMSLHLAYNVADKESIDPPFSAHVKMKETFQDLERGQFHLLWIKHKFPIMQKYQGHRGISSKLSVFAEALVLPWDLHIPESNEDTPTVPFCDLLRDSMKYHSETLPPFKKRKIGHASMGNHYNFDYPSEVLCVVTGRRDNSHCIGKLQCHNASVSFGCSEPEMRKILLEFTFDAFSVYEALRIGCYYIISHNKADVLCASAKGSKVLLNSRIHIWSLSFSVAEISLEESYPQHETQSDVNLFLSPDFISLLEDDLKFPKKPIAAYEEETQIKNCNEASITSLALPSGTRYSGHRLPEGNLISLCGLVCAVHHLDEKSQCVPLRGGAHGGAFHSVLFEETCICVHLMVDQKMAKIYGAIHKSACPAVFGRGVTATFHRVLVLSGHDSFMMIPSSFISVHSGGKVNDASAAIISHYVPAVDSRSLDPSSDVRKALISETAHCSKSEPLLFRCRVVSVYVVIMENKEDYFFSHRVKSDSSSFHVNIPLAGFVLDDGSSSCCCWANSDRAAALLGLLHPKVHHEAAHGKGRSREQKGSSSVGCHLKEVIERHHGRVVVKNHGSTFDPSAQELTITGEDMMMTSSSSDEAFLRMLILNACSSNSLNVAARAVDSEGREELEKQLREVGMVLVPPQMKNVWAFGVDHIEAVAEARNLIQGLLPLHQTHP